MDSVGRRVVICTVCLNICVYTNTRIHTRTPLTHSQTNIQAAEEGCKNAERAAQGAEEVVKSTEGEREETIRRAHELGVAKRELEMLLEGERGDLYL